MKDPHRRARSLAKDFEALATFLRRTSFMDPEGLAGFVASARKYGGGDEQRDWFQRLERAIHRLEEWMSIYDTCVKYCECGCCFGIVGKKSSAACHILCLHPVTQAVCNAKVSPCEDSDPCLHDD